jgi:hypothetical protein
MDAKRRTGAAVVTAGAAQAALRRGATRDLSPEEEKVMRMRLGAAPPPGVRLERVAQGLTDLEIEVLAYEIEAFMRLRALRERGARPAPAPAPAPSRTKEKIVRALRKKV